MVFASEGEAAGVYGTGFTVGCFWQGLEPGIEFFFSPSNSLFSGTQTSEYSRTFSLHLVTEEQQIS